MKGNYLFGKALVFFGAILFTCSFTMSQKGGEDWVLVKSENHIEVFAAVSHCDGHDLYLVKAVNSGSEPQSLDLLIEVTNEPTYIPVKWNVTVDANSFATADCDQSLNLYVSGTDKRPLNEIISITFN